jgi:hypothetical protein
VPPPAWGEEAEGGDDNDDFDYGDEDEGDEAAALAAEAKEQLEREKNNKRERTEEMDSINKESFKRQRVGGGGFADSSDHPGYVLAPSQDACPPGMQRIVSTTVSVSNISQLLPAGATGGYVEEMMKFCGKFGEVADAVLARGECLVRFRQRSSAEQALSFFQTNKPETKAVYGKGVGVSSAHFNTSTGECYVPRS